MGAESLSASDKHRSLSYLLHLVRDAKDLALQRTTGVVTEEAYRNELEDLTFRLRRWLTNRLGSYGLASTFAYEGLKEDEVFRQLRARFSEGDAKAIEQALGDFRNAVSDPHIFARQRLAAETLATERHNNLISEADYLFHLGAIKKSLTGRLREILGKEESGLASQLIYFGKGKELVAVRLRERYSEEEAQRILSSLSYLETLFPDTYGRLEAYEREAQTLAQGLENKSLTESEYLAGWGRLRGRMVQWLSLRLGDRSGLKLSYNFFSSRDINQYRADVLARLEKTFGVTIAARLMLSATHLFEMQPKPRANTSGRPIDIDAYARRLEATENKLGASTAPHEEYRNQIKVIKAAVARWLDVRLGSTDGHLGHKLVYEKKGRERVVEALARKLGQSEALRIMATLDKLIEEFPSRSKGYDRARLKHFANEVEELKKQARGDAPVPPALKKARYKIRKRIFAWLSGRLATKNSDPLAHGLIYEGKNREVVLKRLTERFGIDDATEIVTSLDRLRRDLAATKQSPLGRYIATADLLVEERDNPQMTKGKLNALRRRWKNSVHTWLANQIGDEEGKELSRSFVYDGLWSPRIAQRLREQMEQDEANRAIKGLLQLRNSLATLSEPTDRQVRTKKEPPFPFHFGKKNLLRDFVPLGFARVHPEQLELNDLLGALREQDGVPRHLEVLSIFTKNSNHSPTPLREKNIYLVFRDPKETNDRGLVSLHDGRVKAARIFSTHNPKGKRKP